VDLETIATIYAAVLSTGLAGTKGYVWWIERRGRIKVTIDELEGEPAGSQRMRVLIRSRSDYPVPLDVVHIFVYPPDKDAPPSVTILRRNVAQAWNPLPDSVPARGFRELTLLGPKHQHPNPGWWRLDFPLPPGGLVNVMVKTGLARVRGQATNPLTSPDGIRGGRCGPAPGPQPLLTGPFAPRVDPVL
jgi:hypothetical protein